MTATRTRRPRGPQTTEQAPEVPTPVEQIDAYLDGRPVSFRKRELAVERHTAVVAAAGGPVPLDWFTRQLIDPARGVGS
ncbi:hypothetical protein [Georgenia yuyongxinii]